MIFRTDPSTKLSTSTDAAIEPSIITINDYHTFIITHYFNEYRIYNIAENPSITLFFGKLIFLKPRETNVSVGMVNQLNLTGGSNMSSSVNLVKGDNRNSGISLPKAVMARIDSVKHPDIPRSKFVLRILEAALIQKEIEAQPS